MWTAQIRTRLTGCIFALLALVTLAASAADRPFPANAKRGTMSPANFPSIIMDGRERILSAGAQIRNADNLIELPGAIRGTSFVVNYTENLRGDIDRIWLLSADEARHALAVQNQNLDAQQRP
jgi:hypothetical protein